MKDERYVCSSLCTWHGPIWETIAVHTPANINGMPVELTIPGCPHCQSPLYEFENRAAWDAQVAKFNADHQDLPLYVEWVETLHGPCKPLKGWDWRKAYTAYLKTRMT